MQEPESPRASPPSPAPRRKRRQKRTVYSIEQRLQLEEFYKKKRYGTYEERETLAKQVKVQEHQVQVWLTNRRAKDRKLQRLSGQQGPGAHTVPQEPGAPAPQPEPVAGGPAFQGYPVLPASPELPTSSVFPEEPVFPPGPVLPAAPLHQGDPAFCSFPPHSPFEVFPEPEHCAFSYSQACWGLAPGVQGTVPAALAPAPAPAQARAWPQGPHHLSCSTNPVVTPRVTELRSPKGPWEGQFSSCQPWAEQEGDSYTLLGL